MSILKYKNTIQKKDFLSKITTMSPFSLVGGLRVSNSLKIMQLR
jgi:hypothetical protein